MLTSPEPVNDQPPKRDQIFNLIALFIYALAVLIVTQRHEPWRDEADVWLIVLHNDLSSLWQLLRYSGTPGLWHALLLPVARAGMPYPAILLVNNIIAIAAAATILFRAPFPRYTRILIVFSSFIAFEYAVIARSYALTVLLATLLCAMHTQRLRKPIIYGVLLALLFNTSVHGLIIAAVLLIVLLADIKRDRIALTIGAMGLIIAIIQIWPMPDSQESFDLFAPRWVNIAKALRSMTIPAGLETNQLVRYTGITLNTIVIIATIALVRRSRLALAIAVGSFLGLMCLFVWVYYGNIWHAGMLGLAMLVAAWIGRVEDPDRRRTGPAIAIHLALAVSCIFTLVDYHREWTQPHSDSRNVAQFIVDNNLTDRTIAAFPDPHASAVKAWLPNTPFWYAGMQDFGSHMTWNADYVEQRKLPYEEAMMRIMQQFPNQPDVLVLLNQPMQSSMYREIYRSQARNYRDNGERYILYEPILNPSEK